MIALLNKFVSGLPDNLCFEPQSSMEVYDTNLKEHATAFPERWKDDGMFL